MRRKNAAVNRKIRLRVVGDCLNENIQPRTKKGSFLLTDKVYKKNIKKKKNFI